MKTTKISISSLFALGLVFLATSCMQGSKEKAQNEISSTTEAIHKAEGKTLENIDELKALEDTTKRVNKDSLKLKQETDKVFNKADTTTTKKKKADEPEK